MLGRVSSLSRGSSYIQNWSNLFCNAPVYRSVKVKVSNFQGNSPISLPTALTGAPGEITIKETSVCVLSVSISTTPVVGADMKDLPALTEPKF